MPVNPCLYDWRPLLGRRFVGLLKTVACSVLVGTSAFASAQVTQNPLPTIDLYAGMHRIVAEVASTPDERAVGLMGRTSMPENHGMLFIFPDKAIHCFWMMNTLVPLSIAFLREDGTIVNIADMQPRSRTSHCPEEPVQFALEMNQGWFAQRNMTPGISIRGLPKAR